MNYYYSKTLDESFNSALSNVKKALREEGFGILSDIDVQKALNDKLNVTFKAYRILGACNPLFAHKALLTEDKIGTMLPCNVIVQDKGEGKVEVAAVKPIDSMQAIDNHALKDLAGQVQNKLEKVIDRL